MHRFASIAAALAALAISGCSSPTEGIPGDAADDAPFAAIGANETVRFTGTEPFWGGQVVGTALTYSTPEDPDGTDIVVTRFAGRGGLSWSGTYDGARFVLAVTPGECSDGMSDRTYPFVATLEVKGEQRSGCAWTETRSFTTPDGADSPVP
ncbi:hypothetical protein N0B51_12705 [Tsuneonella sp. YG55]|uniref:Lipoprotein n=1 Tax=Tsuneonella litorea TaxID=2976475 RepID=A0A9X2W316_9SPHN|nr:hypothetical protein [Tsuneonella litorea]MCT2559837.1 hypothetical protein [Tsuneonella litorea]